MDFFVGTFNTETIYTLRFTPPVDQSKASLSVIHRSKGIGHHSWLALSPEKTHLYATVWKSPSAVTAYRIERGAEAPQLQLLNSASVAAQNGYVCASERHVFSVSGPSGEVFARDVKTGALGDLLQTLSFTDNHLSDKGGQSTKSEDAHGDFGGIRHGAHSVDLSPDGKSLYVADIGRNCIWCYSVHDHVQSSGSDESPLILKARHVAPRSNDGPRHTTPHPIGKILYSLQEHTSMVDSLAVSSDGIHLEHLKGVSILPSSQDAGDFWADEVRVSTSSRTPKYLYASTRGLRDSTKGYVAVYKLNEAGDIEGHQAIDIFETATSGGIANAVEPAPQTHDHGVEYMALTDSLEGFVFVLSFDGERIQEVARERLAEEGIDVVKAATAVWL